MTRRSRPKTSVCAGRDTARMVSPHDTYADSPTKAHTRVTYDVTLKEAR